MNELNKIGVILSDEDERDYTIARFNPRVDIIDDKEFILNIPNLDVIKDQGSIGACVAYTITSARSIQEYNQSNMWVDFSPSMLYGTRYTNHFKGQGMMPREALAVVNNEGVFFNNDFKQEVEVPALFKLVDTFKLNNKEAVTTATQYKITGYARLYGVNDIKNALKLGMPVLSAYQLYDSFMRVGADGVVPGIKPTDKAMGNHAMLIVGWTKDGEWLVLNSWSNQYGYKGLYKIPYTYTLVEAWSMSDTIIPAKIKAKSITLKIGSPDVIIDGVTKTIDTTPIIINDRTMVPVRVITEALGASVEWIPAGSKIIIRSPEAKVELRVGAALYFKNDIQGYLEAAPIIKDDRTLIPLRFIMENFNCDVDWDSLTGTVLIKCK